MGPGAFPLARHGAGSACGGRAGDLPAACGAISDWSLHARRDAARSSRHISLLFTVASQFGGGCKNEPDNGSSVTSKGDNPGKRSGAAVAHFLSECISLARGSVAAGSGVVQFAVG